MKIDPFELIVKENFKLRKGFYLISGNEFSLMEKIKELIVTTFKVENYSEVLKLENINNYSQSISLFNQKRIIIINGLKNFDEYNEILLNNTEDVFVFISQNNPKIKNIKSVFIKKNNFFLIDCYEMAQKTKTMVLRSICEKNNIKLEADVFWYLVDVLDNKYMLLENEMKKLTYLNKNNGIDIGKINKILALGSMGYEKIFFNILGSNEKIIELYKRSIFDYSDLNKFFYFIKLQSLQIIDCSNIHEFEKKIPSYLFREKDVLLKIYEKINLSKKERLSKLLFDSEKLIRMNNKLSIVLGLRFILNLKRIITS